MRNLSLVTTTLALLLLLPACDRTASVTYSNGTAVGHIRSYDGQVTVTSDSGSTAIIKRSGDMIIEDQEIALDQDARALAVRYFQQADGLVKSGVDIGKAGAALAGNATKGVVKSQFDGNAEDIGGKINADADRIKQRARQLCQNLASLQGVQNSLVVAVPQFAPYASIDQRQVTDCGD